MEREAHGVDRPLQQIGGHVVIKLRQRGIAGDDTPVPVERESGVGLLPLEHQIDGGARGGQRRILERTLGKDRGVACSHQQHIALAHRNVELLGKVQQHVAARLRSAGLDEAQMPGRNTGIAGEVELAEAAALAPLAYEPADRRTIEHAANLAHMLQRSNYPTGNGGVTPHSGSAVMVRACRWG